MVLHKATQAAREGNVAALRELATAGVLSPDIADPQGASLVHHAARCGQLGCLVFLVGTGLLPGNGRAGNGATPAHDASATGHLRELQWLMAHGGCSAEDRDHAGATPLHLAANFGCVEVVRWLLQEGVGVTEETHCGALPLHFAAAQGNLLCLKLLLQTAPGSVNRQTRSGATPLYLACQEGHLPVVEFLLKECGADVHVRANDGMTVLHAASQMGHQPLVVWLTSFTDISLSIQDIEGATALHFAASGGHNHILEYLLHLGAEVIRDYWGGTPLHDAAENGKQECCRVLIINQVGPGERDRDGFTAADLAEYNGNYDCANYLRAMEQSPGTADRSLTETGISLKENKGTQLVSWQSGNTDYYRHLNRSKRNPSSVAEMPLRETSSRTFPPSSPPISNSPEEECVGGNVQYVKELSSNENIKLRKLKKAPEAAKKVLPDMKNLMSLKQAGITAVFAKSDRMVVLPTEEANLSDIDYLVPTTDEKGRPIAEWRRQVMVRQLQAWLQDEENQRRKDNGNKYTKLDSWRYSQARNAILGPFGEYLTEDDLIYLEKQIENVSMHKNSEGYEMELARLAEELRTILPAPIVNITANTQFKKPSSEENVSLPVWCYRISGIVKSMSLLTTNVTDQSGHKMKKTELVSVFSQGSERQKSSRGRRDNIEREIQQFGVSVRTLKANFESQNMQLLEVSDEVLPYLQEELNDSLEEHPEEANKVIHVDQASDSSVDLINEVMETTSLRKERIVVLFLGHWKKSAYNVTMKGKNSEQQHLDDTETVGGHEQSAQLEMLHKSQSNNVIENGSLSHFFKQRSTINKMIGNWRSMNSKVPSRQIRRLNRQQVTYSPEQFLPRIDGSIIDYNSLTLDLFMLGYFHILELDLSADERKMRHLLCFEVFDHVGRFSWETVRDFHKAVLQDIEAGNREWKDGFEDIKIRFFGNPESTPEPPLDTKKTLPEKKTVPKVIIQTPTPDENDLLHGGTDISSFSNEEICKYIDRSFAFWKEKEAEIFDFE